MTTNDNHLIYLLAVAARVARVWGLVMTVGLLLTYGPSISAKHCSSPAVNHQSPIISGKVKQEEVQRGQIEGCKKVY